MEIGALVDIWVTTPFIIPQCKETDWVDKSYYINLRTFKGNVQESFSELELKVYGEVLNQMQKIFTNVPPLVLAKDQIYFTEPIANGTILIDGVLFKTYPKGVATAEKPKSQYIGVNKPINPTYINIKFDPL